jgi:hypothetical protein
MTLGYVKIAGPSRKANNPDTYGKVARLRAVEHSNDTIGVNNKPAYMNFSELFISKKAKFIWSSNVVLDNHVIVRKTVK